MEKDKEKAMYESPVTRETRVNLESGICAGSITGDSDTNNATTTEHEVNNLSTGNVFSVTWD